MTKFAVVFDSSGKRHNFISLGEKYIELAYDQSVVQVKIGGKIKAIFPNAISATVVEKLPE